MNSIRTPDQRLRVFISSTIEELREERRVAREAIASLRLIPVFFEAGARPHAPRELYRAYLDQSDIFIGIYASSYGWVAPDMGISGLEDEYRLSAAKPRLIYIKEEASARDSRLSALIDEIRASSTVSYQKFRSIDQLADLLRNDLALLLSERFNGPHRPEVRHFSLPAMRTATIGRARERAEIAGLIMRPHTSLVTLTGTGGTGKSHLALRVAHDVADRFADGAAFVPLAGIQRHEQVMPAIAAALGVVDSGHGTLLDAITEQLADKAILLVVDNFEHVLDAAPLMSELLGRLPRLMMLVTSRAPLHLVGEQVYQVQPLPVPAESEHDRARLLAEPSVDLFVQRARARASQLALDDDDVLAVATMCRQLDGLPLAIELAAAHTKTLTPAALAARMDRTLDLLARGPRDLPERQRTMRAAIASSVELLAPPYRAFFRRLAVFSDRWTMEQAGAVTDAQALGLDPMEAIEQLIDMGLTRVAPARPHDPPHEPRFLLLHVVREFAAEELEAEHERAATLRRLSDWCTVLVRESYQYAGTDDVMPWMDRVEASYPDLRAIVRDAMDRNDVPTVWTLIAHLNTFWLLRGYRGEALDWLRTTGLDKLAADPSAFQQYPPILLGGVLFSAGTMCYYAEHLAVSTTYLERAVELYGAGEVPHQLVFYGWLFLGMARIGANDPKAGISMDHALRVAREAGDRFLEAMALCYNNEVHVRAGDLAQAQADLDAAKLIAREVPRRLLKSSLDLACGNFAALSGRYEEALASFTDCLAVASNHRIAGTVGWALNGAGYCLLKLGRADEAHRYFVEGIESARQGGYRAALMAQWMGLAWVAAVRGDHVRGARLLGAADALRASIRYSQWTVTRHVQACATQAVSEGMDKEALAREVAVGGAMRMEEVLALAAAP